MHELAAELENAAQALHGQHAWLPQRQIAHDGEDELFELFVGGPSRQSDRVQAARQLNVAVDGVPRLQDPKADQRNLQLVAQKAKGVQDDALFAPGSSENIVDLVDDEDLEADLAKNVEGAALHIDDAGAWAEGASTAARS